jgi:hypothetical protein
MKSLGYDSGARLVLGAAVVVVIGSRGSLCGDGRVGGGL